MTIQTYTKDKFLEMDPMHDSVASQILVKDNSLIVIYNDLDEGVFGVDGKPFYKYKTLKIKYDFVTFCDARVYYKKNKYKEIDLVNEMSSFDKMTTKCFFISYKYAVDSFNELLLHFFIDKIKCEVDLKIRLDAETVTYYWE